MYFLQGLLIGLATFAPVGMQNLFIINTALVQPIPRIILTILIVSLFDMSLSTAAFFGIGTLLEIWPILKLIVLLIGGLIVTYMGYSICNSIATLERVDTNISIRKIIMMSIIVSWGNPQAIIDASMTLGAFRANIPHESIYQFFTGFMAMTPIWFGSLSALVYLVAKKINTTHLTWINRICGIVLIIYGVKLVWDGINMVISMV